jgi:hypothetical protein
MRGRATVAAAARNRVAVVAAPNRPDLFAGLGRRHPALERVLTTDRDLADRRDEATYREREWLCSQAGSDRSVMMRLISATA